MDLDNVNSICNCFTDLILLNEIGQGAFSTVYKVKSKLDHNIYALKQIDLVKIDSNRVNYCLSNEINIIKNLNHPNIVKYYCSFQENNYFNIILEYCASDLEQVFIY